MAQQLAAHHGGGKRARNKPATYSYADEDRLYGGANQPADWVLDTGGQMTTAYGTSRQ